MVIAIPANVRHEDFLLIHDAIMMLHQVFNHDLHLSFDIMRGFVSQVNQMLAMRAFPETGSTSGKTNQGGEDFIYTMNISPTPNYSFRRIELSVSLAERPEHILAQQVFYAARVD